MSKILIRKEFLLKLVSILLVVAVIFATAFVTGTNFSLDASAEQEYNYTKYGTIKQEGSTLTAVPNNGVGFRGWVKDGKEVSYLETITLNSGETAKDYTPVFYNFSLLENGSFENTLSNDDRWFKYDGSAATVSSEYAKSGSKSLKSVAADSAIYHDFKNLELETQYTIKFSYYIPSTSNSYLSFVSVLGENMTLTNKANSGNDEYLACKRFTSTGGACAEGEWKDVSITFYTDKNTTAKLALTYVSGSNAAIYIDDVSITRDNVATPTYLNETFTSSVQNWKGVEPAKTTIKLDNGQMSVNVGKNMGVYSAPFVVKKDAYYTLSFDLDLSQMQVADHTWVYLSNVGGVDRRYSYATSGAYRYSWSIKGSEEETTNFGGAGSFISFSSSYFNKPEYDNGKVVLSVSFRAHETKPIYLNINPLGGGTFKVDNIKLTENIDVKQYVKAESLAHVGSAIRVNGKQGIRYKTELDKRFLISEMPYDVRFIEYGTIAIKTDYLGGKELKLDTTYNYKDTNKEPRVGVAYSFADEIDKVFAEEADKIYFTGVLTGIGEKDYNTSYTVRAYFKYVDKNGNEGVIYTPQNDIAVYPVAKAAYSGRDGHNQLLESEETREYLLKNILSKYSDKVINVKNNSTPIYNNFQGVSTTVYHGTVFFDDAHGRKYTTEQAQTEIDRLVDSGITNVRTRLASQWMEAANYQGWNWNSAKMNDFYDWGKMLTKSGITLTINIGWHLVDFTEFYDFHFNGDSAPTSSGKNGHSSIPEVNYLHGYTDNKVKINSVYGEDSKAQGLIAKGKALNLDLTDSEYKYFSVAAARYGEWGKQALLEFKKRGIKVEYIMPFTETGYYTGSNGKQNTELDPTFCYDEWIFMTMGLHQALSDEGIRVNYKLIGPSQSENVNNNRKTKFIEYIYQKIGNSAEFKDMIDINSMHCYPQPHTLDINADIYTPDSIYNSTVYAFDFYNEILENAGQTNKEFWVDEFFIKSKEESLGNDAPMLLTQFAVGMAVGMNKGINRFISWQLFDTLWDANATHTTGEFVGGIHVTGTCPRLVSGICSTKNCSCKNYTIASYKPRTTYYGLNLLGKHFSNKSASVLATEILDGVVASDSGVYTSAITNDYGKTVILVVNTLDIVTTVNVNLETVGNNFERYVYDSNEIVPTAEAKSIPSDKTLLVNKATKSFADAIPARSFAIYVESNTEYGDVDIPGGDIFN